MEIIYLYVAFSYLFMFGVLCKNWPDKAARKTWLSGFIFAPILMPTLFGAMQE